MEHFRTRYWIVKIGGKQYQVEKGTVLFVEKIKKAVGAIVDLDVAMSVENMLTTVNGKKIQAKILEHGLSDKLDIFKYKPKKNYRKRQGHRQPYTKLEIL